MPQADGTRKVVRALPELGDFMAFARKSVIFVAASLLALSAASAADRVVTLRVPPALKKDLDAMPRIAKPADRAERRINAALNRLDVQLIKDVAECKDNDGKPGEWERSIEVSMHGPGYLSFLIHDNTSCGGAHPNADTSALVFDLKTGAAADWRRVLPPALTGTMTPDAPGLLSSKRLYDLYVAGYDIRPGASDAPPECKDAVRAAGASQPPVMEVWPDAKSGGLAVSFELPHAVQGVCGEAVTIPIATLRAEGAKPALLEAIEAAGKTK